MADVIHIEDERGIGYISKECSKYIKEYKPDKAIVLFWHDSTEDAEATMSMLYYGADFLQQLGMCELAKELIREE